MSQARSISTTLPRETPQNKLSVMRNYLTTPMSSMSNQGRVRNKNDLI